MSEATDKKHEVSEQLSDILLVLDKEKMKIQAVKSIDKSGKMQTVDPSMKNESQFMRVDKHGDIFSNFFTNFFSQLKNPTNFSFFKVPAPIAVEKAEEMQKHVDKPTPEGEKAMKEHEVKVKPEPEQKQENNQENQNNMETTQTTPETGEYRFKPEEIDWETMNNLGLGKERLEKLNLLDPLLKGYKTNELVPVSINLGGAIVRTDARLSLQPTTDGKIVAAIHGIRKEPNLNFEFFGHKFTDEDKKNLLKTGNMGRVVNLTHLKTGEIHPSIVSVDRLTNELIALKTSYIKIPDEIKGVKLDDTQKQTLMEGKPLHVEGMISKKGAAFDATVQYNADKHYVEFLFDKSNTNQQAQGNKQTNSTQQSQKQDQQQSQEAPKIFRGKELTDEQYNKFKDGQTVYVELKDKKDQPYQGYITFNKENGKTNFEFPSQFKERVKPTEAHKTQTAVNSEGKTNEATKNINEPLQKGQQAPKNKKQQEQQESPKAPAKSKGIKR